VEISSTVGYNATSDAFLKVWLPIEMSGFMRQELCLNSSWYS